MLACSSAVSDAADASSVMFGRLGWTFAGFGRLRGRGGVVRVGLVCVRIVRVRLVAVGVSLPDSIGASA